MKAPNFTVPIFVPANRPERFEKAAASGADAVIIDLEDAVPREDKDRARTLLSAAFSRLPVIVRINGEGTAWHAADLDAVLQLDGLAGVMLPKAELGEGLRRVLQAMQVPLLALVETVRGLAQAREIAALRGVERLVFGSVDFCADLGCAHTREALAYARSEIVIASRLAELCAPLDGVTTSIDDIGLLEADARHALEIGFGGKLAIHPRQIAPITAGFSPSDCEITWADRVLSSGDGATSLDGAMVDEPVRSRARSILARAAALPPKS